MIKQRTKKKKQKNGKKELIWVKKKVRKALFQLRAGQIFKIGVQPEGEKVPCVYTLARK